MKNLIIVVLGLASFNAFALGAEPVTCDSEWSPTQCNATPGCHFVYRPSYAVGCGANENSATDMRAGDTLNSPANPADETVGSPKH